MVFKYLQKVLEKYGMDQCKIRSTPCEANPSVFNKSGKNNEFEESPRKHREIIGGLIYAMTPSWLVLDCN